MRASVRAGVVLLAAATRQAASAPPPTVFRWSYAPSFDTFRFVILSPPPTPACLRSTDRTLWGSAGGVLYLLARLGSWIIDLVPSRHPYVARRARARRLCQEWGAQTGPAGADTRIRASEESIATKAQKQASASVRLRVFYWLVRGIFVSRRELSNKVTWGCWGREME